MKNKSSTSSGFTLIELLVVVAIVAILSGIVMSSLSSARSRSRDAERISDISSIQGALTSYFIRCGQYPETLSLDENAGCPGSINLGSYIKKIPTSPNSIGAYRYGVDYGPGAMHSNYVLATQLENNSSVLNDSLQSVNLKIGGEGSNVVCDKATFNYCVGPK